jgi:two-component system, chemotaxis family, sensor kinase CheA
MSEDQDFLKELQKEFLDELQFLLEACEESYLKIENPEIRVEELAKIFRLAHSIKGAGAAVGFTDLAGFAHVVEDCLAILRAHPFLVDQATISLLLKSGDAIRSRIELLRTDAPPPWNIESLKEEVRAFSVLLEKRKNESVEDKLTSATTPAGKSKDQVEEAQIPVPKMDEATTSVARTESTVIKVDSAQVETILNIVGELVVIKSQIINEAAKVPSNPRLNTVISLLDKNIRDLQDRTLGMRMTPLKNLFLKTQRVARDLSIRLKKPVDFRLEGEEIEIDRNMVEQLSDPLLHLIRNCIDHGIEMPEVRKERGKSEKGLVKLSAHQSGGRVHIRISDDGNGINRDRILKKAVEVGLIPATVASESLSDAEVFDLLFAPGFSTAEKVTDISGRGVGMNVVKENLEALKGKIDVESVLGKGSSFKISVPLTTSITDGMLVRIGGQVFILPMDGIQELINLRDTGVTELHSGDRVLNFRGHFYPVVRLEEMLRSGYHGEPTQKLLGLDAKGMVVLYECDKGVFALEVDGVLGQTQVVMKPIGKGIKEGEGVSGAAILGDGKVALLIDVNTMLFENAKSA